MNFSAKSRPSKGLSRALLATGALLFASNLSLYGQATVTTTQGQLTTTVSGATTASFNEVNPTTWGGGTYTSPTSMNGTLMIANTTATTGNAVTGYTYGSFVTGSSSGQYGAPTNDATTYLSIGGARAGALTLTFSQANINYFGLDWASPDTYNSVTLTFKNGTTATYTPGTANGGFNLVGNGPDSFVNFTSTSPTNYITQVQLSSSQAAFELDNVAFGAVPEPATWLGGTALACAAGWLLLRRSGKATMTFA